MAGASGKEAPLCTKAATPSPILADSDHSPHGSANRCHPARKAVQTTEITST
jgi:hypothetical protein